MEKEIAGLSIEEKVGQMFMLAFPGTDVKVASPMIQQYKIGGCYISDDNARTPSEALELSSSLQAMSSESCSHGLPLILGVDQEGTWSVLGSHSTSGPGNLALGAVDDPETTRAIYKIMATEMVAVGYNTIFSPCCDVNTNPQNPIIGLRSFGEDPKLVARHVQSAILGAHEGGAICTVKHFPGHGDTRSDSHRDVPVVTRSLEDLPRIELFPFAEGIRAGVDMVMTAHILFPAMDPENPATMSDAILRSYLRDRLGFTGIVVSDSMNMKAIRSHYDPGEAAIRAIVAGVDLIMLAEEHYDHDVDYRFRQESQIEAVLGAVRSGRIPMKLVNDAVERIAQLKRGFCTSPRDPSLVGRDQARDRAIQAAYKAIFVEGDISNVRETNKGSGVAIINSSPRSSYEILTQTRGIGPNQEIPAFDSFVTEAQRIAPGVNVFNQETVAKWHTGEQLENYQAIILVVEDYPLPGVDFDKNVQLVLFRSIIKWISHKLVILALRSPYDKNQYREAGAYMCTYSSRTCAATAAAMYLFGDDN